MASTSPSQDEQEEILLSCRYGELDELKQLVDKYGADAIANVRDENENTVLHMIAANGHDGTHPSDSVV